MLDQIHGDDPLQTSSTGAVDGDKDSSESEDDPCVIRQTQNDGDVKKRFKQYHRIVAPDSTRKNNSMSSGMTSELKMQLEQRQRYNEVEDDDNDITDDEDEDDYTSTNHTADVTEEKSERFDSSTSDILVRILFHFLFQISSFHLKLIENNFYRKINRLLL